MTRHERNDEFALTSFLHGANATFLTELYARYQNRTPLRSIPNGVASSRASAMRPTTFSPKRAGPLGARRTARRSRSPRLRLHPGDGACRIARYAWRPAPDPRLPDPRPSHRQARSARAGHPQGASRSSGPRLTALRSRITTGRSFSAARLVSNSARSAKCSIFSSAPTPIISAPSTCIFRIPSSAPGFRSASRAPTKRCASPRKARRPSSTS